MTAPNTFGGFIELNSPRLSNTMNIMPYGTAGSFGTQLYGPQAETDAISQLNGACGLIDLENLDAGGAANGTATRKRNGLLKFEQPIGETTVVTVLANLDYTFTTTPYGATLPNIEAYGRNYALNNGPASQSFLGYNHDDYTTDFEDVGIERDIGNGLTLDDKLYTTSYYQRSRRSLDLGGLGPNLSGINYINGQTPVDLTGDVPGMFTKIYFRNTGNRLRLVQDTPFGQARIGVWAEHELYTLSSNDTDLTRGVVPVTASPGSIFVNNYRSNLNTVQPYAEFAWKPPSTVTAAGYTFTYSGRKLLSKVNLYNVTDDRNIIGYGGATIGPPFQSLYWTNSGRSMFFSLAAKS